MSIRTRRPSVQAFLKLPMCSCRRGLAGYERVLGGDHPGTVTSVNNLAGLYASQGRYEETETLHQCPASTISPGHRQLFLPTDYNYELGHSGLLPYTGAGRGRG